jgi:hypothetical protein
MAAVDEYMWVEADTESMFIFFYCRLCPLTIPFLKVYSAHTYAQGHKLNSYHKRRLELQR